MNSPSVVLVHDQFDSWGRMTSLILGVLLLGFGMFYFSMLGKVPAAQKTVMTVVAAVNTIGGIAVLTMVLLGIMK
jgi:fumarate reductase subunit D